MDVRPESLGAMLEYWYIERGLLLYMLYRFCSGFSCPKELFDDILCLWAYSG